MSERYLYMQSTATINVENECGDVEEEKAYEFDSVPVSLDAHPRQKLAEINKHRVELESYMAQDYPFAEEIKTKIYYPEEYMDDSE